MRNVMFFLPRHTTQRTKAWNKKMRSWGKQRNSGDQRDGMRMWI